MQHIINAGLLTELQEYLNSAKSNQSFEIFCVQIVGNLAVHQDYTEKIVGCYSLCQWLVRTMGATRDQELRHEIGITLRNLAFHRNANITGSV
jgi:hypothetical protein